MWWCSPTGSWKYTVVVEYTWPWRTAQSIISEIQLLCTRAYGRGCNTGHVDVTYCAHERCTSTHGHYAFVSTPCLEQRWPFVVVSKIAIMFLSMASTGYNRCRDTMCTGDAGCVCANVLWSELCTHLCEVPSSEPKESYEKGNAKIGGSSFHGFAMYGCRVRMRDALECWSLLLSRPRSPECEHPPSVVYGLFTIFI